MSSLLASPKVKIPLSLRVRKVEETFQLSLFAASSQLACSLAQATPSS